MYCTFNQLSLKFVADVTIDNKEELIQMMAWREISILKMWLESLRYIA